VDEVVKETKKLVNELFGSKYSFVEPLSGTIVVVASIMAYTEYGDEVMIVSQENGGSPVTSSPD